MSETKEEIAADRDALRADNEQLRAQLAAGGVQRQTATPAHQFVLSEGQRQELITYGVTNVGGRRATRADVEQLLDADQQGGVDLGDREPVDGPGASRPNLGIPGVDFVYPSVLPGAIDPAVAGTPGINGPAATPAQLEAARSLADSDVSTIEN